MNAGRQPLLPGLAFSGYRSFAHEPQRLLFPTPVTVLAGVNNSGKSNVLRYVQHVLPQLRSTRNAQMPKQGPTLDVLDIPTGYRNRTDHVVSIPLTFTPLPAQELDEVFRRGHQDLDRIQRAVMTLLASDGVVWAEFIVASDGLNPTPNQVEAGVHAAVAARGTNFAQQAFERGAVRALGGGTASMEYVVSAVLASMHQFATIPPVTTVSASRRVEINTEFDDDPHDWMSGRGLVKRLAELQNPVSQQWPESRAKWDAINEFVQHVLDDPDARLNIPHDVSTIQIETPRRVLPLANLGSGIEQVIVLAAAATIQSETLVCMEEPESNLHPVLQQKVVRYLTEQTTNQYLIATHSAHFLDYDRATVYHLRLTDDGTKARPARSANELVDVCNDLGYKPSDLMQSNCVIWVEGPSDRIYLRRWLELFAPDLCEGADYKIMFYGGSLLTHLTVTDRTGLEIVDEVVDDFINLRLLNRASVIVMDSDRKKQRGALKPAVQRLRKEYASGYGSGHAWVTSGYTVENYLPTDALKQAVALVHPSKEFQLAGKWDNPLPGDGFNKNAIARKAVGLLTQDNFLTHDLKKQLTQLAKFIRAANERVAITDSYATK